MLIILLLVAGIAIVFFIAGQQRLNQETKVARLQADYEKELRIVGNEVQEQVLTNVAAELHDNIGQLLTSMHLQLENKRLISPQIAAQLHPIDETLLHTIKQVKLLGRGLNGDMLLQNGLAHNIQSEMKRLEHLS